MTIRRIKEGQGKSSIAPTFFKAGLLKVISNSFTNKKISIMYNKLNIFFKYFMFFIFKYYFPPSHRNEFKELTNAFLKEWMLALCGLKCCRKAKYLEDSHQSWKGNHYPANNYTRNQACATAVQSVGFIPVQFMVFNYYPF